MKMEVVNIHQLEYLRNQVLLLMRYLRNSSQSKIAMEKGTPGIPNCQKSRGRPPNTASTPGTRIRKIARRVSNIMP